MTLAQAASVTLAWDPNTEPDIAGYKLYYGTPAGNFSEMINTGNVTNTTVSTLVEGNTYAFYVTCYNTSGLESEPSNVVEYTVPTSGGGENRPPIALGQSVTAVSGQEILITLAGNDPDADPLSFNITAFAASGEMPAYATGGGTRATVTYRSTAGFVGTDFFTFNVDDGYSTSADATVSIQVIPDDPRPFENWTFFLEAESGVVTNPLTVATDPGPVEFEYVTAATSERGSVTYTFDVPIENDYVVWCRVRTTSAGNDSFYVVVDNTPATRDIYDAAWEQYSDAWKWTELCGRGGVDKSYDFAYSVSPRIFHFTVGTHQLTFEGRERDTDLDALLITSDRSFNPVTAGVSAGAPVITEVLADATGETSLTWSTVPGLRYQVLVKGSLTGPVWVALPEVHQATTNSLSATVSAPVPGAHGFFSILLLP